jgi:predicted Zn-dependent protease
VYLISGASPSRQIDSYRPTFQASAESFRPLSEARVAKVQESRLRVRTGRGGETLERFVKRTGSSWNAAKTAVANALEDNARLTEGKLMKASIPQAYTTRRN